MMESIEMNYIIRIEIRSLRSSLMLMFGNVLILVASIEVLKIFGHQSIRLKRIQKSKTLYCKKDRI